MARAIHPDTETTLWKAVTAVTLPDGSHTYEIHEGPYSSRSAAKARLSHTARSYYLRDHHLVGDIYYCDVVWTKEEESK